jgi:hypothetical protein
MNGVTNMKLYPLDVASTHSKLFATKMSEIAFHLTLRGWETGEPPPDRIETWLRLSFHQSKVPQLYIEWSCLWANPSVRRTDRDALRAKFNGLMGSAGSFDSRIVNIGEPL